MNMKWVLFGFGYFAIELVMHAVAASNGRVAPPEHSTILWYGGKAILVTVVLLFAIALLKGLWAFIRHGTRATKEAAVDATRVAPYVAGRATGAIERTARDAAAAFKAGRDR
jgi:hypothetical protein